MTEFIGYISLSDLKTAGAFTEEKSVTMATYMLCGFANFSSIGIQIGGIGSLAPNQRKTLSEFGIKALILSRSKDADGVRSKVLSENQKSIV